ncbi:unnamed protein product [Parascedosporium putredinis]|uniref:Thioredoxin domain-containing protein n=1 Tax=Parascedosporium putredinis TaxID=1442378 RepID=A0A9P1M7J3_9PEZI|nr:unnamed protein product [Parascedosporium putredinis]CAI7988226.1 unnamed protein product [Parascedosporium putredinis]
MAGLISISSSAEWANILKTHNIVIADFYADWCGPCKMIAPHFERLAKEYAVPKKVAFARSTSTTTRASPSRAASAPCPPLSSSTAARPSTPSAAPTPALTSAITDALKLKDKGGSGEMFKSPGRSLGGGAAQPAAFDLSSIFSSIVLFAGLYFASLLSARVIAWFRGNY